MNLWYNQTSKDGSIQIRRHYSAPLQEHQLWKFDLYRSCNSEKARTSRYITSSYFGQTFRKRFSKSFSLFALSSWCSRGSRKWLSSDYWRSFSDIERCHVNSSALYFLVSRLLITRLCFDVIGFQRGHLFPIDQHRLFRKVQLNQRGAFVCGKRRYLELFVNWLELFFTQIKVCYSRNSPFRSQHVFCSCFARRFWEV